MIKNFFNLINEILIAHLESLTERLDSVKTHSFLESHYKDIGEQLFEIANNHVITEEQLIENCKIIAEFADLTAIQDIEKYLFINRDKGLIRQIKG